MRLIALWFDSIFYVALSVLLTFCFEFFSAGNWEIWLHAWFGWNLQINSRCLTGYRQSISWLSLSDFLLHRLSYHGDLNIPHCFCVSVSISVLLDQKVAAASSAKDDGNAKMRKGKVEDAIEAYSIAIQLDDTNHLLYFNRCVAYEVSERPSNALADAEKVGWNWGRCWMYMYTLTWCAELSAIAAIIVYSIFYTVLT